MGGRVSGILAERIAQTIFRHRTQRAWAKHLGVSPAFVCKVIAGNTLPTPAILDDLGLERVVTVEYRPTTAPGEGEAR